MSTGAGTRKRSSRCRSRTAGLRSCRCWGRRVNRVGDARSIGAGTRRSVSLTGSCNAKESCSLAVEGDRFALLDPVRSKRSHDPSTGDRPRELHPLRCGTCLGSSRPSSGPVPSSPRGGAYDCFSASSPCRGGCPGRRARLAECVEGTCYSNHQHHAP